jgi:serine/threonine protein phosphatase 1
MNDLARAHIPAGFRLYVVGDIHGRADLLENVLGRIEADASQKSGAEILYVFLGDYVDRGPASKDVIQRLLALSEERRVVCLKGNHEAFLLDFLSTPAILRDWSRFGGLSTLMSYGLRPPMQPSKDDCMEIASSLRNAMPQAHLAFFQNLHVSLTFGDFFFVHAGVRPHVALEAQSEDDLLWIREDFLLHEKAFEKVIVHGHSPVLEPEVRTNRINIDTGAYATGRLTCLVLEDTMVRFIGS